MSERERHRVAGNERDLFDVIEENRPGMYYLAGTAILSLGVGLTHTLGHGLMVLGFLLLVVALLELNAEVEADD